MQEPDLVRQLRARAASLKAAGVEFLLSSAGGFTVPQQLEPAIHVEPLPPFPQTVACANQSRRTELQLLAETVQECTQCSELHSTRTQTVFGVGNPSPEICMVGEAPGGDEDRQGEPFVGPAGQLLNRIILKAGLKREELYICNVLKCRPPGNRKPASDEIRNCLGYLKRQIELLAPKVIFCLGGVAANTLLQNSTGIMKLRGQLYNYKGIPLVCTYHPSYLLRLEGTQEERRSKFECWDDVKLMLKQIGREVPGGN